MTLNQFEEQIEKGIKQITDCELNGFRIYQKDLSEFIFRNVSFKNMDLVDCNLKNVFFSDCRFVSVDFNACNCEESVFYNNANAPITPGCGIKDSIFRNTLLSGTLFHTGIADTFFENVIWRDAELTESIMDHCRIHNSQLDNSKFERAVLNAEVSESTFKNCNLNEAVITDSVFKSCNFSDSTLEKALLKQESFDNCELATVDFSTAVTDNVSFQHTQTEPEAEGNKGEINAPVKPHSQESPEKLSEKLSGNIVSKINLMKKDGTPMRVCPNGQVYIDPEHLKYFKRNEINELEKYYENKYGKTFQPYSGVTSLPDDIKSKIEKMEAEGGTLKPLPDGRVKFPLMHLRYFTNLEIEVVNSYFMNLAKELKSQKSSLPFSEGLNKKLELMEKKGLPMRICPNGQVEIQAGELRYFKAEELKEINQYYIKKAEKSFVRDPAVKTLPEALCEKLKAMERETGKKIMVSKTGRVTMPPGELFYYSDQEIGTLNSYYLNKAAEQTHQRLQAVPELG